jgi:hypothetical protein
MIFEKKCSHCGEVLPVEMFFHNKRNSTGYCSYCKICAGLASKEWRSKNCDKVRDRMKDYRQANKERANELRRNRDFLAKIMKLAAEGLLTEVRTTKVCTRCKVEQPNNAFNKNGKKCWCRGCCKPKVQVRENLPEGVPKMLADEIVSDYNQSFENSLVSKLSVKYQLSTYKIRTILKLANVKLRQHRVNPVTTDYYVYIHKTLDGTVFYVGKGIGKRAWSKFRNNKSWTEFTKHNEYVIEIFKDGLTENDALELEQQLFEKYRSTLLNKVSPAKQKENTLPTNLEEYVYYDELSPTKLRWNRNIPLPHGGFKYLIGDVAGAFHGHSKRGVVGINGQQYYISRVVCVLHGLSPSGLLVDHVNGDCTDDRIGNLRLTTPAGNSRNTVKSNKSNTGVVGVYEHKTSRTFIVSYRDGGVSRSKRFRFTEENKDAVFKVAVEYRMKIIRDMAEMGIIYSDRHLGVE